MRNFDLRTSIFDLRASGFEVKAADRSPNRIRRSKKPNFEVGRSKIEWGYEDS
jgi:hypothetical protein